MRRNRANIRSVRKPTALSTAAFLVFTVALSVAPRPARAGDRDACVEAANEGQSLRGDGRLVAAKQRFVACGQASCPGLIARSCVGWLDDLERQLPSIVVRVVDESESDVTDAEVTVDGARVVGNVGVTTGRAIEIDPGRHVVRASAPKRSVVEQTLIAAEGEKRRLVRIRLAADAVAAPPSVRSSREPPTSEPRIPTLAWPIGGIALAALTTGGILGGLTISRANELADDCGPTCPASDRQALEGRFLVADILGAVGLVAAGVFTYLVIRR